MNTLDNGKTVLDIMEAAPCVNGLVHRRQDMPPTRENQIMAWRLYLRDLEAEAEAVREALAVNFSDQRIDMEIELTVESLRGTWPECADYSHDDCYDYFTIFDKNDKVIGTISDDEFIRYHLVSLDETGQE